MTAERSIREEVEASLDGVEDIEGVDDVVEEGQDAAPEGGETSVDEGDTGVEKAGPGEPRDAPPKAGAKRGPDGKFAASAPAPAAPDEPKIPAPPGFSVAAKKIWDSVPKEIKADIAKRETEMNAGLQRYTGLGRYAEEAERNGTSLQAAVTDYVAVETELRKDFLGGIEFICRRMGVDPRRVAEGMAGKYAGGPPRQQEQPQPQHFDPNAIAQHAASVVRGEIEQRELSSQIEAFKADPKNQFFENVRQDMATLVQSGKAATLQEAYEAACWLNPEIRQVLINGSRQTNAGQKRANAARSAAKAVGGAPSTGYAEEPAKPSNKTIHDEVLAAVNGQLGS